MQQTLPIVVVYTKAYHHNRYHFTLLATMRSPVLLLVRHTRVWLRRVESNYQFVRLMRPVSLPRLVRAFLSMISF